MDCWKYAYEDAFLRKALGERSASAQTSTPLLQNRQNHQSKERKKFLTDSDFSEGFSENSSFELLLILVSGL